MISIAHLALQYIKPEGTMIIVNAKIYTMEQDVIPNGFIEAHDGVITRIGEMSQLQSLPDDAIDVKGAIVCPGFVDAHCHLGMWEDGMGFEGDDGNEATDPSTPHLRAIDAINPRDNCFKEALSAGVTTVVTGPGSANPIGGQLVAIKTLGGRIDDIILKEPLAFKFALGENPKGIYHGKNQSPETRMATAAIIREQLYKARKYMLDKRRAQTDEDYDEPEYDMKCEALLPLLEGKVKAHFHAHRTDDIFTAIRIAREFNLDYVILHCTEGHLIAPEMKKENACAVVGPVICERSKPELRNLTPATAGVLHENGVQFAICTDHPVIPIQYLPLCAGLAVREGLPYEDALRAITINAARICGLDDRIGSLAPGKDCDLAVFDTDPFSVYAKPSMVFVNGVRVV